MKSIQLLGKEYLIETKEERRRYQCGVIASAETVLEQLENLAYFHQGEMSLTEQSCSQAAARFARQIRDEARSISES